uniref:Bromodomain-containing protein 8 n=1 Tax=Scophthalmus maximus TaxID=52904 RepID=A0A8D3AJA3_SCOMX
MSTTSAEHKLLVIGPTEPWSVREKLCLATSVMKSGDQNWVSVSRAIKPFAEPGRPPDWFSQKHCASKYSELLETTEAPKRKRGEKGEVVETVEDVIVRRLTADRINQLKKLIKETQEKHRKLKREAELIQAGHLDSKLEELWEEILQKKKLEEEEEESKRKSTDSAYQGISFPYKCLVFFRLFWGGVSHFSCSEPWPAYISHGSLLDDPTQKKLLCQKATPTPSPLLSELLKKGSILASNSRLQQNTRAGIFFLTCLCAFQSQIGECDVSTGNMIGAHDLQLALPSQPLSQATAGAPMLSRLLEAGPAQFSAPLSFMVSADSVPSAPLSAATPLPVDSTASASTGLSTLTSVPTTLCSICRSQPLHIPDVTLYSPASLLRFANCNPYYCDPCFHKKKTADEAAEALDAAAVEAALSLCEENGHALSGAWQTGPFQPHEPHPSVPTRAPRSSSLLCSLEGKTEVLEVQNENSASLSSLCNSQDHCLAVFPAGLKSVPLSSSSSCNSKSLERCPDASGTKVDSEINRPEVCGEEDGDGAEGFSSEPDGETEPEPAASESEDGYSLHTASSSLQLHTTADSIASSPASSQFSVCSEDLEALQAHKIWKKAIMLVWRAAANHRYANVFLQPVTDDIAPGYRSIVHRPMDLAAIKKNIETSLIRTTAEFQRDIMLMFQNAVMYNSLDHDVYHMALEMQRDVLEQIQQFLATQLIMETAESGISAKSLRGRESTRKQDSTDKDTVSMSSPAFLLSLFDGGTRGRRCAIEADLKMKK